jgi:hypothetical protein
MNKTCLGIIVYLAIIGILIYYGRCAKGQVNDILCQKSEVRYFFLKTCIWEDTMKTIIKDNNEQINSRAGLGLPVAFQELL